MKIDLHLQDVNINYNHNNNNNITFMKDPTVTCGPLKLKSNPTETAGYTLALISTTWQAYTDQSLTDSGHDI